MARKTGSTKNANFPFQVLQFLDFLEKFCFIGQVTGSHWRAIIKQWQGQCRASAVAPSEASCRLPHDKTRFRKYHRPTYLACQINHSLGNGSAVHPVDAGHEEQTGH